MRERYSKGEVVSLHEGATALPEPTLATEGGDTYPGGSDASGGASLVTPADLTIKGTSGASTLTAPVVLWMYMAGVWHESQTLSNVDIVVNINRGWSANFRLSPNADRLAVEAAGVSAAVDIDLRKWNAP